MTHDGSKQPLGKKGGITYSCEILCWFAVSSAERNDFSLSVSIINSCLTMLNKSFYNVNTHIGLFCELGMRERILDAIRRVCRISRLSTEQYQLLYDSINIKNPNVRFIAALKGERVFAIEHYQAEYKDKYRKNYKYHILLKPSYSCSFINALTVSNLWIDIISNNPPHFAMTKIIDVESQYFKKGFFYSRPNEYLYRRYLACQSRTIAFQLGLAIEIYRNQTGNYPDTLETLVPDIIDCVPIDPYNGKPYHYEKTENEITVFSEGRDDSTNPHNDSEINNRLIWRVPRIEKSLY
jgi:hypothetical protein